MKRLYPSALGVCVFAVVSPMISGAELTPELIADLKMVEEVRLSPDGRWVSYLVADETAGEGGKAVEFWLATTEGPLVQKQLLPDAGRVQFARWSPDGHLAVVVLTGQPRRRQILLLDPPSGNSRVLVDGFNGESLEWSPDGKLLGFLRGEAGAPAPKPKTGEPQLLGTRGRPGVTRFHTIEVATGEQRARTPATHSISDYAWSPRSDAVFVVARSAGGGEADDAEVSRHTAAWILAFDGAAEPRKLFPIVEQTIGVAWSPDGKTVAWCGREFTEGSGQLMLAHASGDPQPRTVQADFPGSLHHIVFRADGRLAFGALENLRAGIYSVAADGTDLRADHPAATFAPGSLGVGSFTKFTIAFSADGSRVASMVSGPREPANVIAGPWGGELTRRTALNPQVRDLAWSSREEISWCAADGLEIHGFLVKPANFDPAKKYPLVVEVHGGPRRSWWATCFLNNAHWAEWIASHGYVVLLPNPRGSEGRGAAFVRGNARDLGGGDWRDVVAGLNHVLALGFIDPERLAIAGWSYGGYLTARGITQPEGAVFKAAIVGAGITNIFARGGAAGGWAANHWGDPKAMWTEPHTFFDRSPIAHVKNVRAATLLLHGDNDAKVPHGQAVEFFTALRGLGVTTEARLYPGEGHGIGRRDHRIDLLHSIARWLKTHVPPGAQ